jgi:hypothetical protein
MQACRSNRFTRLAILRNLGINCETVWRNNRRSAYAKNIARSVEAADQQIQTCLSGQMRPRVARADLGVEFSLLASVRRFTWIIDVGVERPGFWLLAQGIDLANSREIDDDTVCAPVW